MTRVLRIAVPILLLALVWHLADGRAVLAQLRGVQPGWLALALLALHAQTLASARRWRLMAGALGQRIGAGQALRECYVAQLVNQTLPGGVTGDAARAYRLRGDSLRRAVTGVVAERLVGQAAMLGMVALGVAGSMLWGRIDWPGYAGPILAVALAGAALALVLWRAPLTDALRHPVWTRVALLSVAIVGLNLMSFAAAARATGAVLPPEAVVTLIPLILCAMLIPVGLAGWGWREGAAAALFPLAGLPPAAGVAASLTFGALMLAAALPGALWIAGKPAPGPQP